MATSPSVRVEDLGPSDRKIIVSALTMQLKSLERAQKATDIEEMKNVLQKQMNDVTILLQRFRATLV